MSSCLFHDVHNRLIKTITDLFKVKKKQFGTTSKFSKKNFLELLLKEIE